MSLKFRQFRNNSCVFYDTPKNFRCNHRRSDCCILCQMHIQENIKQFGPKVDRIFSDASATRWLIIFRHVGFASDCCRCVWKFIYI